MNLTPQQGEAFTKIKAFLHDQTTQVFVLLGHAGTGKTTLVREVITYLKSIDTKTKLLATTGRAAKVLSDKSKHIAETVHKCIYAYSKIDEIEAPLVAQSTTLTGQLQLNFGIRYNQDEEKKRVYIIDEASMISNQDASTNETARFGSGNLLDDLFTYVKGAKMIFVGDPCQLPPVAPKPFSAALSPKFLSQQYGIRVAYFELTTIVRQAEGSEILKAASQFRQDLTSGYFEKYPKVRTPEGLQIHLQQDTSALLKVYLKHIEKKNYEQAIMIGHSNWLVGSLNDLIRKAVFQVKELHESELLMVVQNNHLVPLVNGDQVVLESASYHSKKADLTFFDVRVQPLHNKNESYKVLLIIDLLFNNRAGLTHDENQRLIIDFDKRMKNEGIKRNSPLYKIKMQEDIYLNALRAKFGYAITCHKSQGGEWPEVFINIHRKLYGMQGESLYRWYYTALTRARDQLHVNDGWWVRGYNYR